MNCRVGCNPSLFFWNPHFHKPGSQFGTGPHIVAPIGLRSAAQRLARRSELEYQDRLQTSGFFEVAAS
jgi:hypothetical protein